MMTATLLDKNSCLGDSKVDERVGQAESVMASGVKMPIPFTTILPLNFGTEIFFIGCLGADFVLCRLKGQKFMCCTDQIGTWLPDCPNKLPLLESPTSFILDAAYSAESSHVALVTDDKMVLLYKLDPTAYSCRLVRRIFTPKKPTCVRFLPNGERVLVANKYGDVFDYPARPEDLEEAATTLLPAPKTTLVEDKPILGHVSILLDMQVSSPSGDRTVIISSDHDEHIRVSRYPRSEVIHGFCLGHTGIVSKICTPKFLSEILISASSDGTIRLWNYMQSSQLYEHGYFADIAKGGATKRMAPFFLEAFEVEGHDLFGLVLGLERNADVLVYSFKLSNGIVTDFNLCQSISIADTNPEVHVVKHDQSNKRTQLGNQIYSQTVSTVKTTEELPTAMFLANSAGQLTLAVAKSILQCDTITEEVYRKSEKLQTRSKDTKLVTAASVCFYTFDQELREFTKNEADSSKISELLNSHRVESPYGFNLFNLGKTIKD